MRFRLLAGSAVAVALSLAAVSCGGGGQSSGSPTSPTPSGGGGGGAVTVAIVGINGAQSFSPNPATVSQGSAVVWTNNDGRTHHLVANDGSFDTGALAPGASSAAMTVNTNGANYHCTIHPSMVGSVNASTGAPPPCSGPYC